MADQGAVWEQLADRASEVDVDSPTGAMRDLYARHETDMAAARQALTVPPGQVGALIYVGQPGEWARPPSRPRALRPRLAPLPCGLCG